MSGLEHWLPSHDSMSGTSMLLLWAAGAVAVLVIVLGALAFRDDGMRGTLTVVLRGAAVLVFAALAWAWLDFSIIREQAAERRALDERATALATRALAPGSALACLNGAGSEAVESACLRAVFANPQAVAAAVAYVEARLKLLADGLEYARRVRSYAPEVEGLRRGLEADRYGVVAHVLASGGCTADNCPAFKLFRDPGKVRTNLMDRYFEAHVVHHSANWKSDNVAAIAGENAAAPAVTGATPPAAATSALPGQGGGSSALSLPSAASIPPISIMNAEPTGSTAAGGASGPPPPREAQGPPSRQQSANRPAQQRRLPPPPPQTNAPNSPPANR